LLLVTINFVANAQSYFISKKIEFINNSTIDPRNKKGMDSIYLSMIQNEKWIKEIKDSTKIDTSKHNAVIVDKMTFLIDSNGWRCLVSAGEGVYAFRGSYFGDLIFNISTGYDKIVKMINHEPIENAAAPLYVPKWSPKFIREQDQKKHHKN